MRRFIFSPRPPLISYPWKEYRSIVGFSTAGWQRCCHKHAFELAIFGIFPPGLWSVSKLKGPAGHTPNSLLSWRSPPVSNNLLFRGIQLDQFCSAYHMVDSSSLSTGYIFADDQLDKSAFALLDILSLWTILTRFWSLFFVVLGWVACCMSYFFVARLVICTFFTPYCSLILCRWDDKVHICIYIDRERVMLHWGMPV